MTIVRYRLLSKRKRVCLFPELRKLFVTHDCENRLAHVVLSVWNPNCAGPRFRIFCEFSRQRKNAVSNRSSSECIGDGIALTAILTISVSSLPSQPDVLVLFQYWLCRLHTEIGAYNKSGQRRCHQKYTNYPKGWINCQLLLFQYLRVMLLLIHERSPL